MLKTPLASVVCLLGLFTAFTLFGRFDAMAQQPIQPVPFTPFGDGQDSVLMADLKYQIGNTNYVIIVPAGFVTDFASTPRAIWAVLPPVGQYQLAAVVHDFLYWDQGCTREQADALLWVAMTESRVERAKRDVIWEAVRKFGSTAWADNASAKAAGQPRIIPKADLQIPALVTWKVTAHSFSPMASGRNQRRRRRRTTAWLRVRRTLGCRSSVASTAKMPISG